MRVKFLANLLAVGLIARSLLLGCGGEGEQNGPSKGSKAEQTTQKASGKEKRNKQALKGRVASVLPDKDNLTVEPKNGGAKTFKYKPDKVKIELDGKKAGPDAIEEGQRVKVKYSQAAKASIARSIKLHSKKSGTSDGETTG
ncbi:MAG: hypothetical protein H0U55_13170 [Rubrobacteraceae bacterium]|nr:hypothetical protein [Rubrobacteraceae bacterium]